MMADHLGHLHHHAHLTAPCAGPDRDLFLPSGLLDPSDVPAYLNGELPGE